MNYAVGGNTKIYGSVLLRYRERDFAAVPYQNGSTTTWGLTYADFEPYYTEAEALYQVHGQTSTDPTTPPRSADYPFPPVAPEPQLEEIATVIAQQGLHPTHLPLGLTRQADDPSSDAEVCGIMSALKQPNVTLKTGAKVVSLHTNPSGQMIKGVEAELGGQSYLFLADIVVVACGAVNSAALLLRSGNDAHPKGLANRSDQVGRNLMKSLMTVVVQLSTKANSGMFPKSLYVNDFYWGDNDFPYPMGHIYNTGGLLADIIFAEAPPLLPILARFMPGFGLKQLATHSIGWWVQSADLPEANNRVYWKDNKIVVDYNPNNSEAHDRLVYRWMDVLKTVEKNLDGFQKGVMHPRGEMPLQVMAHQCGTCRMGTDPATSVLDLNCRAHDLDNLYIVDASCFPTSASISPALTIMANALRVGDHLLQRLG
jgi:choline dehydrogenase-like flavoprotein